MRPDWRMAKIYEALADEVEKMTDEELLAEAHERGVDTKASLEQLQRRLRGHLEAARLR